MQRADYWDSRVEVFSEEDEQAAHNFFVERDRRRAERMRSNGYVRTETGRWVKGDK